jgi:hypothetical protein
LFSRLLICQVFQFRVFNRIIRRLFDLPLNLSPISNQIGNVVNLRTLRNFWCVILVLEIVLRITVEITSDSKVALLEFILQNLLVVLLLSVKVVDVEVLLELALGVFSRFLRTLLRLDLATVLQPLFEEVGFGDELFGLEDLEDGHFRVRIRIIHVNIEGACHYVLEHRGDTLLIGGRTGLLV